MLEKSMKRRKVKEGTPLCPVILKLPLVIKTAVVI